MKAKALVVGSKLCPMCNKGNIFTGDKAKYNAKSLVSGKYICADCAFKEIKCDIIVIHEGT